MLTQIFEFLSKAADLFLHLDHHLSVVISTYGAWTYLLLFLVVFCETGLVATPFLPGDSLLFAAGTFAALGALNPVKLLILLSVAAIIGDTVNYWVGHALGPRVFHEKIPFLKKEYLDRTREFYDKHGNKTIVLARFVPIVRTFAPFVAGVGNMPYGRFITYNVVGGLAWTSLFILGGYYFGNIPVVRNNFSLVIMAIIGISVMPMVLEIWRQRRPSSK